MTTLNNTRHGMLRSSDQQRLCPPEQARRALFERLTSLAGRVEGLQQVLAEAMEQLCAVTGWPVGHLVVLCDRRPDRALPTSIWHLADAERYEAFRVETEAMRIRVGVGVVGEVVVSGVPRWMVDLEREPGFLRRAAAAASGLRSGVVLPIRVGTSVEAAIEFYAEELRLEDADLLGLLADIGTLVGRAVDRGPAALAPGEAQDEDVSEGVRSDEDATAVTAGLVSRSITPLSGALLVVDRQLRLIEFNAEIDRFWQARQQKRAGAGLGLAIVKGVVEAHGGRVWVESRRGAGSRFNVLLPAV